jgi:FKBP-type peptidyl-prolyl cis-trans isomerase SlyD
MQIGPRTVVSFEYTLEDDGGKVLDSSTAGRPLTYLHGAGNIVVGLERALEGKAAGDALAVTVGPDEGYGRRDESRVRNLPLRKLGDGRPVIGRRYQAQLPDGAALVLVTSVSGDYAQVDANHPLADKTLRFAVKVVSVREATAEELAHGHVHGEGGHRH